MDRLLNVMSVASLLLIGLVLTSVRREHIRAEYSVTWLLAGLALLVVSLWRKLDERLAAALGVPDLTMALLTICGVVFLGVLFALSLRISELKDGSIKLAQRVAILEFRLESLTEQAGVGQTSRKNESQPLL
jgi:hypothetical protein